MKKGRVFLNIFSNWMFFVLAILIAFIVSPIMVKKLGNETYGIWVLMVSISSYFTVLDFGINTALVRFISKYTTLKNYQKAAQIYSASFIFFLIFGVIVIVSSMLLGRVFRDFFGIETLSERYIYFVFVMIGVDLAINLTFSVLSGTLRGLGRFLEINIILSLTAILKNTILVYLLMSNYSILSLAMLQASFSILSYLAQYLYIRKKYAFLKFRFSYVNRATFRQLFNYSIYSFLIAFALKVLFYTDSVVIGSMVTLEGVTYYAIPAMIVENLEKFIWAIVAVLIPIISSQEAVGNIQDMGTHYIIGTKYSLLLCAPVIVVLSIVGDDFIGLWIGETYAKPSGDVLNILLIGYVFALGQLIAQGILKGISKHRVLAYILCMEAIGNLLLSVLLAPKYGINGVAIGTTVPLLIANIVLIPYFTCRELNLDFYSYLLKGILLPIFPIFLLFLVLDNMNISAVSYFEVVVFSFFITLLIGIYSIFFQLEKDHRDGIFLKAKMVVGGIGIMR